MPIEGEQAAYSASSEDHAPDARRKARAKEGGPEVSAVLREMREERPLGGFAEKAPSAEISPCFEYSSEERQGGWPRTRGAGFPRNHPGGFTNPCSKSASFAWRCQKPDFGKRRSLW